MFYIIRLCHGLICIWVIWLPPTCFILANPPDSPGRTCFPLPSLSFLLWSQLSGIPPDLWQNFTPFLPCITTCLSHFTACSVLYCWALSSSVCERRTEKWRAERHEWISDVLERIPFWRNIFNTRKGTVIFLLTAELPTCWSQSPSILLFGFKVWPALREGCCCVHETHKQHELAPAEQILKSTRCCWASEEAAWLV